ncbi:hypothetical protein L9F63_008404, partial [Diploptera punctata]
NQPVEQGTNQQPATTSQYNKGILYLSLTCGTNKPICHAQVDRISNQPDILDLSCTSGSNQQSASRTRVLYTFHVHTDLTNNLAAELGYSRLVTCHTQVDLTSNRPVELTYYILLNTDLTSNLAVEQGYSRLV